MKSIMQRSSNVISCIEPMAQLLNTLDPFLFCAFHEDHYPAGDKQMQAPRKGNGADFNQNAPYRMYHGDRIPGFPQHPHRGFETLTCTVTGLIDHSDSMGNAGRYGGGDLQWMTAGKGIVHGEMFPLLHDNQPNTLKLFQIWLNLPKKSKMVEPSFVMHWNEEIPKFTSEDGKNRLTVWAGEYEGIKSLTPPPASYANDATAELAVYYITLTPGASVPLTIKAAKGGDAVNRRVYFLDGDRLLINDNEIKGARQEITVRASQEITLRNPLTEAEASNLPKGGQVEVLILQGRPIGEPVVQHGPFVMNTREEIMQAFTDYQRTQFGGWPWPNDAMVFPRTKGRFALLNGVESKPPVEKQQRTGDEL